MPGIDYRQLRAAIAMAEVLQLIGFVPAQMWTPATGPLSGAWFNAKEQPDLFRQRKNKRLPLLQVRLGR